MAAAVVASMTLGGPQATPQTTLMTMAETVKAEVEPSTPFDWLLRALVIPLARPRHRWSRRSSRVGKRPTCVRMWADLGGGALGLGAAGMSEERHRGGVDLMGIAWGRATWATLLCALALSALGCSRETERQTQGPKGPPVPTSVESKSVKNEAQEPQDPRDRMMGQIAEGVSTAKPDEHRTKSDEHATKSILARGCDPQMALRASKMLPPHLGNPQLVSATHDDDFIEKLRSKRWSVVFFAPGACRYDAAKKPIPGATEHTRGWSLADYRALVRQVQGEDVQIVETTDERQIIPLLRRALAQSRL